MTLDEFGRQYGLKLVVTQQDEHRFTVCFKGTDLGDGPFLCSAYGDGRTPEAAKADYAEKIAGKMLVVYPGYRELRRDIEVPDDLREPVPEPVPEPLDKPSPGHDGEPIDQEFMVFELRDYIAIHSGIRPELRRSSYDDTELATSCQGLAEAAYAWADMMLAAREKTRRTALEQRVPNNG